MPQTVVFMFLVTLTLTLTFELCSIFCHTHWNLHAKFHKNLLRNINADNITVVIVFLTP